MLFGPQFAKVWNFRLCKVTGDLSVWVSGRLGCFRSEDWLKKWINRESSTWSFCPFCRYNFHSLWIKEQTQCKDKNRKKKGGFWRLLSFHGCSRNPTLHACICVYVCACMWVCLRKCACKCTNMGTGLGTAGNINSKTIYWAFSGHCSKWWGNKSEENIHKFLPYRGLYF